MLIVRGTKKLRDRMKGAPAAQPDDESTTELGDWFATPLFWKPQVAMLVNTRTFLAVVVPLAPTATLLDRIPAAIAEVLEHHGVASTDIDAELTHMSEVRLAPTNDQRVIGVMNGFTYHANHWRNTAGLDLVGVSMQLSDLMVDPLKASRAIPADELRTVFTIDAAGTRGTDATVIPFPGNPLAAFARVHQLKVTLRGIQPRVWRRVVVAASEPLHHLHEVIQAAFGWYNSHLHMFDVDGVDYGIPHPDDWTPVEDERRVPISQIIGARKLVYTYDIGDAWTHDIMVEKTFEVGDPDTPSTVPDCIGGSRACPPEDCGGPWGYQELLSVLADSNHPERQGRLDWLGGDFDPEHFDPREFAEDLRLVRLLTDEDEF